MSLSPELRPVVDSGSGRLCPSAGGQRCWAQLSAQSVGRLQDYRQLAHIPGGQENARSC